MTIDQHKEHLRTEMRKQIASLRREEIEAQTEYVFDRIEALDRFQEAETVGVYWAMADELPTQNFINKWVDIKKILLPVVIGDTMIFRQYMPSSKMGDGYRGIKEPTCGDIIPASEIDILIIPGMAFDHHGHRLGRGKGYYDKYLADCGAYRIGVCLSNQIIDELPTEAHDETMDIVMYDDRNIMLS